MIYNLYGKPIYCFDFRFAKENQKAKYARFNLDLDIDSTNYYFSGGKDDQLILVCNSKSFKLVNTYPIYFSNDFSNVDMHPDIPSHATIIERQGSQGNESSYFWLSYGGEIKPNVHVRQYYNRKGKLYKENYFKFTKNEVNVDLLKYSFRTSNGGSSPMFFSQEEMSQKVQNVELIDKGKWVLEKTLFDSKNSLSGHDIKKTYSRLSITFRSDSLYFYNIPICESRKVIFNEKSIDALNFSLPSMIGLGSNWAKGIQEKVVEVRINKKLIDFEKIGNSANDNFYFFLLTSKSNPELTRLVAKIQGTYIIFKKSNIY